MIANYMVRTGKNSFRSIIFLENREVELAFFNGTPYATVISVGAVRMLKKKEAKELYDLFGLDSIVKSNNDIGRRFEFILNDDLDWERINQIIERGDRHE